MQVRDRDGSAGGGAPPADPTLLPTDEGPMRGELRRQIALLERDIAAFVAANCPHEPLPASPTRGPGLLSTAELEEIRDELLALRAQLHERLVQQAAGPPPAPPRRRRRPGRRAG